MPRDSSILLDIFEMVEKVLSDVPGTLLVHCSAGVGRAGAFIALYKLIKDIEREVNKLNDTSLKNHCLNKQNEETH